jgi:protease IV
VRIIWTTLRLLLFWLPARSLRAWLFFRRSGRRTLTTFRLSGAIEEEEGASRRMGRGGGGASLLDLMAGLRAARQDPSVEAIAVRIGALEAGWATLDELRRAVLRLREAGMRTFAYLESPGHAEYYLATAFEQIVCPPMASLDLVGLRSEITFFKGTLELLGVEPHFEAEGDYKSFAEPFERDGMSDAFRESLDGVLGDLHGRFVAAAAEGRGMTPEQVQALLDRGPWSAREARDAGLIDRTLYPDRWNRALRRLLDQEPDEPDEALDDPRDDDRSRPPLPGRARVVRRQAGAWLRPWRWLRRLDRWATPQPRVAVVPATGTIVGSDDHEARPGRVAWRALSQTLRNLREDDRVRAVVLRIDSPGGSGAASDLLWRELIRLAGRKPVVASMGSTAASGGYYLAMACPTIFASPVTITGSIGVVAGKFDLRGLLARLGMRREVLSYGANTGLFSPTAGLTGPERERLRATLRLFYDEFVGKAAQGRGVSAEELNEHAQGRIWSGGQALERGLVDELGSLQDAIDEAARKAGLGSEFETWVHTAPRPGMLERARQLLPLAGARAAVDQVASTAGWLPEEDLVQARLPFDLRVR